MRNKLMIVLLITKKKIRKYSKPSPLCMQQRKKQKKKGSPMATLPMSPPLYG
jgi:hypothetical protein